MATTSISFPKMFNKNTTLVKSGEDAIMQNLSTLLLSVSGGLKDDPYYGINLKKYMFNQNNYILRDILIDEIYTQIKIFMPHLQVERKQISLVQQDTTVYVKIQALNREDYTTNMYQLALFNTEEGI